MSVCSKILGLRFMVKGEQAREATFCPFGPVLQLVVAIIFARAKGEGGLLLLFCRVQAGIVMIELSTSIYLVSALCLMFESVSPFLLEFS